MDSADLGLLLSVYCLQATGAIRAKFTWDAENRLVGWEPLLFVSGAKKVTFAYDYLGRRIEKKVYTYNGSSWNLSETRRFIWNDWLLLLELDGDGDVLRKLTWGRDLSGQRSACGTGFQPVPVGCLDGAGGIGGLLSIQDTNGTPSSDTDDLRYVYFYDANGNVGQVIDLAHDPNNSNGAIKAHYEYDAHGNVLVQSGSYAAANPYRFSTKPWDDETALAYWGYRYFDPRIARWLGRDAIEEQGGVGLYTYAFNSPTDVLDILGLLSLAPWDIVKGIDNCRHSAPGDSPSSALLLCQMFKESSFNPTAGIPKNKTGSGPRGIGQIGESPCKDVDKKYNLPRGTCWTKINSGHACEQSQMQDAYLRILLERCKADIRCALDRYRGWKAKAKEDEGQDRYVDPILDCEKCLQAALDAANKRRRAAAEDHSSQPAPCTFGDLDWDDVKDCFDKMTEQSKKANEKRLSLNLTILVKQVHCCL